MPIKSYLATAQEGKISDLQRDLLSLQGCEVIPAENREVVIVVTDTNDDHEDEQLYSKLLAISSLQHITLVSGFTHYE